MQFPSALAAQTAESARALAEETRTLTAVRVAAAPKIDGRDDDQAWAVAPPTRDFRTFTPEEGRVPSLATEARIAYDHRALYVFVRAYDPRPDSIVRRSARRDTDDPTADVILLFIDSFHDRRTGFEFFVTAGGVRTDALIFDDSQDDTSWDGVWDVATRIDSLGWVAEFSIPFNQLRFKDREHPTFGFTIGRWVGRSGERMSFPQYSRSRAGLASQLGVLAGLQNLGHASSVELRPYAITRGENARPVPGERGSVRSTHGLGMDLKWLPRPNVSVDATLNPDFGQVEADPAVLDLSGTEVFQLERRPFFVEGAGLLTLPLATNDSAQLFYSRRVGRVPELASEFGGPSAPTATTILGAAKMTARPTPTTTLAALGALSDAEWGGARPEGGRYQLAPRSRLGAVRVQRDFREGRSGVGFMITGMSRETNDSIVRRLLVGAARSAAVIGQHQSVDGTYRVSGWLAASEITGDSAAIARTQLSSVHAFQRPDDGVRFDPTRTQMSGLAGQMRAGKYGGLTRVDVSYRWIESGFDVSEVGYLTTSGAQTASVSVGLKQQLLGEVLGVRYRSASVFLDVGGAWSQNGLPYAHGLTLATTMELLDKSMLQMNVGAELPGAYCAVVCTRGGPAIVDPPSQSVMVDLTSDSRRKIILHARGDVLRDDEGRSNRVRTQSDVRWRSRSNLEMWLAAQSAESREATHFYRRFGDASSDTTRYAVARLDQSTRSLTARVDYAATPRLTVQWYTQAYLSRGTYSDVREVADARARDWDARFRSSTDPVAVSPGGIDFKQFRSQAVLRWEYRAGSTLFVVWSQARDVDTDAAGAMPLWPGHDLGDLFRRYPMNTVAVKVSYWLSR